MSSVHPADRKTTDDPKCANCAYWKKLNQSFGECTDPSSVVRVDEAMANAVPKIRLTTDLTVCSLWDPIGER